MASFVSDKASKLRRKLRRRMCQHRRGLELLTDILPRHRGQMSTTHSTLSVNTSHRTHRTSSVSGAWLSLAHGERRTELDDKPRPLPEMDAIPTAVAKVSTPNVCRAELPGAESPRAELESPNRPTNCP